MLDRRRKTIFNIAIISLVIAYAPISFSICAQDELDAEFRCEQKIHRSNCSCVKTHDAKGCYIYGKQAFQCRWN